jgi:hypothetical protein
MARDIRYLALLAFIAWIGSLWSLPVHAQPKSSVTFEWTVSSDKATKILDLAKADNQKLESQDVYRAIGDDKGKVAPLVLVVAGVIIVDVLVEIVIKIVREEKGGSFILVCDGKAAIQTNGSFPSNTVIVHDCKSGKAQVFGPTELKSAAGVSMLKDLLKVAK